MLQFILLSALLLLPILLVLRKPFLRFITPKGIKGIPAYSDSKPIWGDFSRMGQAITRYNSFSRFFDTVSKDLGPIAQVRAGFFANFVVLADIPETESILNRPIGTFDRSTDTIRVFKNILPSALLTLRTNETYKHHRRVIGPAMTSKYLSMSTPKAYEAVKELVDYWKIKIEKAGKGKSFEAEKDMESATMDAISGMAFGHGLDILRTRTEQVSSISKAETGSLGEAKFEVIDPPVARAIYAIFETLPTRSALPGLTHFFTRQTPSYGRHARTLETFLNENIAQARVWAKELGAEAASDLADNTLHMMVARELKGDDFLSVAEMKDELFQYLLAGTETSATTLSWFVKYMTIFPDIQHKLRKHVLEAIPELEDRAPGYDDLNSIKLPYLEAVVQETLRLSRTAGGYSRQVMQDTTILGHHIPKGTIVIMTTNSSYEDQGAPVYLNGPLVDQQPSPASAVSSLPGSDDDDAIQYDKSQSSNRHESATRKVGYWKAGTANQFDPSRWLDSEGHFNANAGPSLPFSAGQRGCFGKNLALLELRMFFVLLNQAFFFAPIPDDQNGFARKETVTWHPTQCFVRPVSWDSDEARV